MKKKKVHLQYIGNDYTIKDEKGKEIEFGSYIPEEEIKDMKRGCAGGDL